MLVLGIETSCDETGASVVKDGKLVLSNTVASSLEFHSRYGGVVPEIATRYHLEVIGFVVKDSLKRARARPDEIDLVAVTQGPGLVGALLVGISFAKSLGYSLDIPIIGVNHLWAHLLSGLIGRPKIAFPFIGLVISGGHTSLVFCENYCKFKLIGQTNDDAAGEAFDKVAKILGLGYPGGPQIERIAREGDPEAVKFTPAYLGEDSYDFSFSGIKTAVLYYVKGRKLDRKTKADIAASFQKAVVDAVVTKALDACSSKGVSSLVAGGGVCANRYLRNALNCAGAKNGVEIIFPSFEYSLDNGAMVAAMGHELFKRGVRSDAYLSAEPNLGI